MHYIFQCCDSMSIIRRLDNWLKRSSSFWGRTRKRWFFYCKLDIALFCVLVQGDARLCSFRIVVHLCDRGIVVQTIEVIVRRLGGKCKTWIFTPFSLGNANLNADNWTTFRPDSGLRQPPTRNRWGRKLSANSNWCASLPNIHYLIESACKPLQCRLLNSAINAISLPLSPTSPFLQWRKKDSNSGNKSNLYSSLNSWICLHSLTPC